MDSHTRNVLHKIDLPHVSLISVEDLASYDQSILAAKDNRLLVEFYFTSKSFLCLYILNKHPQLDLITYLDADCYFVGNPSKIIDEMAGYSVGLTPHRFPVHLQKNVQHGIFNAGFFSVRNDASGIDCLTWWKNKCYAWCHDYICEGKYADQLYLNEIAADFRGVKIIAHKGINAAPWNISQYTVSMNESSVFADDDPLILYHFHGLKRIGKYLFDSGLASYQSRLDSVVKQKVYKPYLSIMLQHDIARFAPLDKMSHNTIRANQEKYDVVRSVSPIIWKTINLSKLILKGLKYKSLFFWCR